jgi:hypothetical protein
MYVVCGQQKMPLALTIIRSYYTLDAFCVLCACMTYIRAHRDAKFALQKCITVALDVQVDLYK